MSKKTISIAMCTYNGERFLKDQLESYCRQTRLPDELIVCDDRSQDATVQLINEFTKKSPFTVKLYINEINLGYGKNFEQALSLCQGDIIALSDQDDIWLENRLATFERTFLTDPTVGYAFCDALVVNEKSQDMGYTIINAYDQLFKQKIKYKPLDFTRILIRNNEVVQGCLMVMSQDVIKNALPFPDLWVHDDWISLTGNLLGPVVRIPDVLMKYRLHSHNTYAPSIVAKRTSRRGYLRTADKYEKALLRIMEDDRYLKYRKELRKILEGKVKHAKARSAMPKSFLSRVRIITKEILSLRYFKHSSGLKSIAKDLLLID